MFKAHGGGEGEEGGWEGGRDRKTAPLCSHHYKWHDCPGSDEIRKKRRRGADTDGDTSNSSPGWSEKSNLQL